MKMQLICPMTVSLYQMLMQAGHDWDTLYLGFTEAPAIGPQ